MLLTLRLLNSIQRSRSNGRFALQSRMVKEVVSNGNSRFRVEEAKQRWVYGVNQLSPFKADCSSNKNGVDQGGESRFGLSRRENISFNLKLTKACE